jgi:polysaccharide export outer membrane protein
MRFVSLAILMVSCAAGLAQVGCGGARTYNWAAERAAGYRIGPGDVIRVSVWKHDEMSQQVTVRPDGAMSMPLIGDIMAEGRTVDEVAADIGKRVTKYFADQPPITVQVTEVRSYKVYVVGEVQRGGEFTPNHQVTVVQGLALAGGFTRLASEDEIVIIRKDVRGERRIPFSFSAVIKGGDLQQNLLLQTGDTVIVP